MNINLLFLYRCKQENRVTASPVLKPEISLLYCMYCHIFNSEFNLGFGLPKRDALHLALQSRRGDDRLKFRGSSKNIKRELTLTTKAGGTTKMLQYRAGQEMLACLAAVPLRKEFLEKLEFLGIPRNS